MRGLFEFTGFAGLALALHVAALQSLPQGSQSAGEGGDALVTVAAATGSMSDLVAAWDRPPDVSTVLPAVMPLPTGDVSEGVPPKAPAGIGAPVIQPPPAMAPVLPSQETLPSPDMNRPSPPAPTVVEVPRVRPQSRPEVTASQPEPAAKPAASQMSRSATTAAGSGENAARGTRGPAEAASLSKAARQSALAEWGGNIRKRIDRAKPRGGGRGSVTVVLSVGREGTLQSVGIAKSSGQASLDQRAIQAVRSAGRLPAAPPALAEASYTFRLPIRFD